MPTGCCVVPLCGNRGGFLFPRDEDLKKKWIAAIKRENFTPSKWSSVCKNHFRKDIDYIQLISDDGYKKDVLNKEVVPSVFKWKNCDPKAAELVLQRHKRALTRQGKRNDALKKRKAVKGQEEIRLEQSENQMDFEDEVIEMDCNSTVSDSNKIKPFIPLKDFDIPISEEVEVRFQDASLEIVREAIDKQNDENKVEEKKFEEENNTEEKNGEDSKFHSLAVGPDVPLPRMVQRYCQTLKRPAFDVRTLAKDDKAVHFYTGLGTYNKFVMVFRTVEEGSKGLKYFYGPPPRHLEALDHFFLTLIILRRHYCYHELKMMFQMTEKDVANSFITWIRYINLQWKMLPIWSSRELVSYYCPSDFKDKFPDTRVIIDGTECPVQQPTMPRAQSATWSSYKNRSTVKVLVGATPGGLVSFTSDSWSGSTTDRQVVERTDLTQKCEFGDDILADKGFNVQDLFAPYGIKINMPHFFRKCNRLNEEIITKNKKISSKRVHIERIIALGKTYRILKEPMNRTEILMSSDILNVCFMLCNFRKPIMNKYC